MIVRHTTISTIPGLFRSLVWPVRCARRRYSTRQPPLKLDLLQPHPLIRRIDPGQDVASSSKSVFDIKPEDFIYYPSFFSPEEQAILIKLALWKLDRVDSKKKRTRRRRTSSSDSSQVVEGDAGKNGSQAGTSNSDVQALFGDPSVYGFEEGHFDSVITSYRESLLTAFPEPSIIHPTIPYPAILKKVYGLLPASPGSELARGLYESLVLPAPESGSSASSTSPSTRTTSSSLPDPDASNPSGEDWEPFAAPLQTTTHALHLSPTGRIDPHVDNVDASGSVIIGVSLGAERVLRLERKGAENEGGAGWEVLLKSGSVYVQKDTVRYNYAHSILPYSSDRSVDAEGERLRPGHRISLMIRDAKPDFSAGST